jgi:hypothetical protein
MAHPRGGCAGPVRWGDSEEVTSLDKSARTRQVRHDMVIYQGFTTAES